MIQSMTGFGYAEQDGLKVEVRSLNHKYIDISVRMPSLLIEHEIAIRNLIKQQFGRGKIDAVITFTEKQTPNIRINTEMAKRLFEAFSELQQEMSLPGKLDIGFFSGYRDFLTTDAPEYNPETLYSAVKDALLKAEFMRKDEGEALKKELIERLENLRAFVAQIEELSKDMVYNYKENLSRRVNELLSDSSIDESRLAQEVVFIAQRADITEEVTRIKSHFQQFASSLSKGGIIGRRLDFLLQEMHREANTMSSKAVDVEIINLTIYIKSEIDKIKEQAQNIQ